MATIVDSMLWSMLAQLWQIAAATLVAAIVTKFIFQRNSRLVYVVWTVVLVKCCLPPIWSSYISPFSWGQTCFDKLVGNITDDPTMEWRFSPVGLRQGDKTAVKGDVSTVSGGVDSNRHLKLIDSTSPIEQKSDSETHGSRVNDHIAMVDGAAESWFVYTKAICIVIWGFGVACSAILLSVRYRRVFRNQLARNQKSSELQAVADNLRHRLGVKRAVRIVVTSARVGPIACGLWTPTIVLPIDLVQTLDRPRLEAVLAHELVHVRRGDLWSGLLQCVAHVVWWFHPCVHYIGRRLSESIERCCDEQVVAELGYATGDYARMLVDVLEFKYSSFAIPAYPGIRSVEITQKRLESIMKFEKGCHRRVTRRHWVVLIGTALLILPGQSVGRSHAERDEHTEIKSTSPSLTEEGREIPKENRLNGEDNGIRAVDMLDNNSVQLDPATWDFIHRESFTEMHLSECVRLALRNCANLVVDDLPRTKSDVSDSKPTKLVVRAKSLQGNEARQMVDGKLEEVARGYWELWFFFQNLSAAKTGHDQALAIWQQVNISHLKNTTEQSATQHARASEQYFWFMARVKEAYRDLAKAESRLRTITGYPDSPTILRPVDEAKVTNPGLSPDELVQVVLALHPDLSERRSFIASRALKLEELGNTTASQLLNTPITVSHRKALADIRNAQLELTRDKELLETMSRDMTDRIRQVAVEIANNYSAWSATQQSTRLAGQVVKSANAAYLADRFDLSALLDAQRQYSEFLIQQSSLVAEIAILEINLERVAGRLTASFGIDIVVDTK